MEVCKGKISIPCQSLRTVPGIVSHFFFSGIDDQSYIEGVTKCYNGESLSE